MTLPAADGIGSKDPEYVRTLRTSRAHARATLRRIERSRASAGPSDGALRRVRNATTDISLDPLNPGWPVPTAPRGRGITCRRDCPPAVFPFGRDEGTLRIISAGSRRLCHAEALIGLVGPDENGGDQAHAGEPYHLTDGIDLRPRRPPSGHHGDGDGRPGREVLTADRRIRSSQGEQKVRRGEGHGQLLTAGGGLRRRRLGAERADGSDVIAIGDRHDQTARHPASPYEPRRSLTPTRRAAGAPPRRSATMTRKPICCAHDMASDTRDTAATCGSSTGTTASAAVPREFAASVLPRYATIRRTLVLWAAASPRLPGRQRLRRTVLNTEPDRGAERTRDVVTPV